MKLRTRLTIGMVSISVIAVAVCCILILRTSRASMLQTDTDYTCLEAEQLATRFNSRLQTLKDGFPVENDAAFMQYLFKSEALKAAEDSSYVLMHGNEDIYNNSGISIQSAIAAGTLLRAADLHLSPNGDAVILSRSGSLYCVVRLPFPFRDDYYEVGVIRALSNTQELLRRLVIRCVITGLIVSAAAAAAAALFLKKALLPLNIVRENAEAISAGDYERYIDISRNDELGSLAQAFNTMSTSVRDHIREVESVSEARNLLLHALAHEMRTPVTAISGYASMLQAASLTEDERREAAAYIKEESLRLSGLSGRLSQLVGLDRSKPSFSRISLDEWGAHLERLLADVPGLTVEFPSQGTLTGDPDLLTMLVTNLCNNAVKAGATQITVSFRDGTLSVRDNGCGIPAEQLGLIMQPFYRGDPSRSGEGFGLGLALCSRIAELHGSRLTVESTPGAGSVFSADLYNSFTTP